jgi:hypothetical protein
MIGQLIVVEYNGRHNAFEGQRDKHRLLDIADPKEIAPTIQKELAELKKGGYVLVKFAGQIFICERDNVDPTQPYRKHKITYNPFVKEFTV